MTQATKKLVGDFDALPLAEQELVSAELLRRAAAGPHDLPTDKDLVAAANHIFQELDRLEQQG
jgi:hypothetical protein